MLSDRGGEEAAATIATDPLEEAPPIAGAERRIARNTSVQVVADAISKVAVLAFYVVMARELGKGGFGDFTFAASIVLFIEIAGLGTDVVLTREVARRPSAVHDLFWISVAVKLAVGAAGMGVVVLFGVLGGYASEVEVTLAIMAFAKLLEILAMTAYATFRGLEDMVPVATSLILQRTATAVMGSVALIHFGAGLVSVALLYLLGAALALAYAAAVLMRRNVRPRLHLSSTRAAWLVKNSLSLGLGAIFGLILIRVDVVVLSLLTDNSVVGLYGAGYRLFEGTLFLSFAFGVAVFPLLSRLDRSSTPTVGRAYEIACKVITAVMLPIGVGLALFAPSIIEGLYGESFAGAATATRILGAAIAVYGLFAISIYALAAQEQNRVISKLMAALLVLNLGLNLALIPPLSLDGAAIAMAVTQVAAAVLGVVFAQRAVGSIAPVRALSTPLSGAAAMALTALLAGPGLVALCLSLGVYAAVVIGLERWWFPTDFRLFLRAIRPASG